MTTEIQVDSSRRRKYWVCTNPVIPPIDEYKHSGGGSCCRLVEMSVREVQDAQRAAYEAQMDEIAKLSTKKGPGTALADDESTTGFQSEKKQ